MPNTETHIVQTLLDHIHALAVTIGPRGATRPEERQAAEYARQQLENLGYQTQTEVFRSATSIYHPHIITALLMLAAFIIYPFFGRISAGIAAGLSLLALVSDLLELGFSPNPLRWVTPKGDSQNVFTTLDPQDEHRQDLILVGHLDTHQTGKIFSSQGWVKFFQSFTTLAFAAFSAQVGFFLVGVLTQWSWLWYASIPSAIAALILLAICWEADRAPFSPGANDNASAVAMVLTLAEALKPAPLTHTRVWFVLTGCEEVQHYGMIDLIKQHKNEWLNPKVLVFEMVGVAGPAWETKEGIIVPFKPDQALVHIVETIAQQNPELGAYPSFIVGGNSEMADAHRAGLPAITFFGLTPNSQAPYWHQPEDTPDKMNPDVLANTYQFTRLFVDQVDKGV
jgi:acetylornithine deacetylase/succinyl-diaminopimelate desuccinylase-like protein